jgi:hypothetical protein
MEMKNTKHQSKLPRHINRHYTSIKSNVSRHLKKLVLSNETDSNHRHEFIRKWADDAHQNYKSNHRRHSSPSNSEHRISIDLNDVSSVESSRQRNTSSNNSALVYLKSDKSNDNIECKIS